MAVPNWFDANADTMHTGVAHAQDTRQGPLPVQITGTASGGTGTEIQGNIAHDAAETAKPVAIGGIASDTAPTDVTALDRVRAWFRRNGALAVYNAWGANPADDIHSSLERQVTVTPTIVVDTVAYAIGDVVGGIITLPAANYASDKGVTLKSLVLKEGGGQAPALYLMFFKATPAGGTYTDNLALAYGAGDEANFVGGVSILAADWVVTSTRAQVTKAGDLLPAAVTATSMFMLIIAKSAYDAVAAGDLKADFTFRQHY